MRTWTAEDPKAGLMARKRAAIVQAALAAFLIEGYAGSSVNRIAADAGVSIKTLYRHFDDKADLFVAVIQDACVTPSDAPVPPWYTEAPLAGLTAAGSEHLRYTLSPEQLALYRVVVRESPRFPELGQLYQREVLGRRIATFTGYLATWPADLRAKIAVPERAAYLFSALLHEEILDTALLGGPSADEADIDRRAADAAARFLTIAEAGQLS